MEIVVSDRGSGIPAAALSKLFEFGRTTKGEQGNGLGLWTVKHILDKHGASIQVDSRPSEGTRFVICWPRRYQPAEAPELAVARA